MPLVLYPGPERWKNEENEPKDSTQVEVLLSVLHRLENLKDELDDHPHLPGIGSGKHMARWYVEQALERIEKAIACLS